MEPQGTSSRVGSPGYGFSNRPFFQLAQSPVTPPGPLTVSLRIVINGQNARSLLPYYVAIRGCSFRVFGEHSAWHSQPLYVPECRWQHENHFAQHGWLPSHPRFGESVQYTIYAVSAKTDPLPPDFLSLLIIICSVLYPPRSLHVASHTLSVLRPRRCLA